MARFSKSKPVWGLDIGASAIKGVYMCRDAEGVRILGADILPLEGEPILTENPGRDRRIWRGLQRFATKYALSSERVGIGLPGPVFFARPFTLVEMAGRSTDELVRFEIDQHIPLGLDAVLWDYELFIDSLSGSAMQRDGLLFAMKKEVFNNYFLSFTAAEIEPRHVQATPLALYEFIRYELNPQEPFLVADIGAASTDLLFIKNDRYYVRSISLGVDVLTKTLQKTFASRSLSRDDAEAIKLNLPRIARRTEVMELLDPAIRRFGGELRNAVQYVCREVKTECDKLMLVGGGASMYGLPRLIGDQLDMRVVTPAGLGRIDVAESADPAYIHANLPALAPAIGVGLQLLGQAATRVSMVGATLLRHRSQTATRRIAASVVLAAFLLVVFFGGLFSLRKMVVSGGTEKLNKVLSPLSARRQRYERLRKDDTAAKRLAAFREMTVGREAWNIFLDKLAQMLPENRRRSVRPQNKLWVYSFSIKARPKEIGVYDISIVGGMLLQPGEAQVAEAKRILMTPLIGDERGIFEDIHVEGTWESPILGPRSRQGQNKYQMVEFRGRMVLKREEPS